MWHKTEWMEHPIRLELAPVGLLVKFFLTITPPEVPCCEDELISKFITFFTYEFFLLLSLFFWEFFTPALADGFSEDFDSKSPQVSRTLLSILTDLNSLDGLYSFSYFQSSSPYGDCTKSIIR